MDKKRLTILMVAAIIAMAFWVFPAGARELLLLDKPLTLLGFATQEAALGMHNAYDTEAGLQSALMNLFVEAEYKVFPQFKFYTSEKLSVDWAYQLNANRDSWEDKGFDKSRHRFNVDDRYWQILNEAHVTWTPGNFFFRLGKQIVSWGEVTAFRVMDQINPVDYRRGFADVEFENTLIPIWLLRSEYYPRISTNWLQDLAFEFVFNPNVTWIPNQDILLGNDDGGIWAPNIRFYAPGTPGNMIRIGSANYDVHKPNKWSEEGFGYAFRTKGVVKDFIVSLNYYYGLDHSPVLKSKNQQPIPPSVAEDGRLIIHPALFGRYPLVRYVGLTATRDIPFLKYTPIGGIAPVFRFETFYEFNETFVSPRNTFEKSDELRIGLGIDWKIKIPLLNPKAFFAISPEIIYRRLINLPGGGAQFTDTGTNLVKRNNYQGTLALSTTYFNAKLAPSIYYWRDFTQKADFMRLQATYYWSSHWLATVGLVLLSGARPNVGFEPFDQKDYIDFKITYKWS